MPIISDYMSGEHKACDEAFARAEESVAKGDWAAAEAGFKTYKRAMDRHLAMEEEVLFGAFEEETGMSGAGPTEVMRQEHVQMRGLIDEMKTAVNAKDANEYLGLAETLLVLMQQHNLKEEGMLYRMMDQVLASQAGELIARCNAFEVPSA